MTIQAYRKDITARRSMMSPLVAQDAALIAAFGVLLLTIIVDPSMLSTLIWGGALRMKARHRLGPRATRVLTCLLVAAAAPIVGILLYSVLVSVAWAHAFGWWPGWCRLVAAPLCVVLIVQTITERARTITALRYKGRSFEAWIDEGTRTFNVATYTGLNAAVVSGPLGDWQIGMTRGQTTVYVSYQVPIHRMDYHNGMGATLSTATGGHTATDRSRRKDAFLTCTLRVLDPNKYSGQGDHLRANLALMVPDSEVTILADDQHDRLFAAWIEHHKKRICVDHDTMHGRWKKATDTALDRIRAQAGRPAGGTESVVWSPVDRTVPATYLLVHAPSGRVYHWTNGSGQWVSAHRYELPSVHLLLIPPEQVIALRTELLKAQQTCARLGTQAA
jgi:hypothetical protein